MLRKCVFLEHQHTVPKSEIIKWVSLKHLRLLVYYRSRCGGTAEPVTAVTEIALLFLLFKQPDEADVFYISKMMNHCGWMVLNLIVSFSVTVVS